VIPRNHILDGNPDPREKGHFCGGGHVQAHCNVSTHECILQCWPAAAGECACPAHAADECIRHFER